MRGLFNEEKESNLLLNKSKIKEHEWSQSFKISDIADFQIATEGGVEESKDGEKWYLPVKYNGYKRFIRVMVTTQDEATLFIVFSDPYKPDCIVRNLTNEKIEISQRKTRIRKTLDPKGEFPFIWDDEINVYTPGIDHNSNNIDNGSGTFKVNSITRLGKIRTKKHKYIIDSVSNKNNKEIIIRKKHAEVDRSDFVPQNRFQLIMSEKMVMKCIQLSLKVKSVGISLINSVPKEVINAIFII